MFNSRAELSDILKMNKASIGNNKVYDDRYNHNSDEDEQLPEEREEEGDPLNEYGFNNGEDEWDA